MAYQKGKGLTSRWRVWLNSAFASLCLQTIISDLRVNVTSGIKITLASRTFTSVLLIDHNHNQYNKATCKRMHQLPALLGHWFWELLRPCGQWCANRCNNSQQCWDPQCIVGRIQPIRLWRPCVMIVRGPSKLEELCKRIQNCCPTQRASKKAAKIWNKYLSAKFVFLIPQEVLKRTFFVQLIHSCFLSYYVSSY